MALSISHPTLMRHLIALSVALTTLGRRSMRRTPLPAITDLGPIDLVSDPPLPEFLLGLGLGASFRSVWLTICGTHIEVGVDVLGDRRTKSVLERVFHASLS